MIGHRILATRYTPGADGLRQFRVGELVRLINDIGSTVPDGYVVSNDGITFEVEFDFGGGRVSFDLKKEQEAMRAAEADTRHFLTALETQKACDNVTAYTVAKLRGT